MDNITAAAVQEAFALLKAGKKDEAHAILVPIIKQNPDSSEAWYLLGFTVTDADKKLSCFQQVLRIDPSNQAAQKQVARLTVTERVVPDVGTSQANPFSSTPSVSSAASSQPASTPIPTSIPTPTKQQQSKKRLILLIGIGIAVMAVLIVFGATALYISNGSQIDQEVNALFTQRKCLEVTQQYTAFEKSFPRSIFGSYFGVYHQIEECQAQLALELAVKSQDWQAAYNVIRDYILVHPNGAFVADMSEQAGDILLSWSRILVAANDYEPAIEKLKLVEKFPTSPAGPTAQKALFDDYLMWAKYLFEQKDYQGAEKIVKLVSGDEKASPEQVKQADQGLAVIYLQWGKAEVESGKFDEGVQRYDAAKTLDPNLTDYNRLNDQVTLMRVAALAKDEDFDGALTMVKTVSETSLSDEIKADAAAEETRILDAYAHSSSTQATNQMTTAAANMCQKQPPSISIFALETDPVRFAIVAPYSLQLPSGWMATTPAELHYVLCIDQSQSRVETCSYRGGHIVRRIRYIWTLTLYDVATGKSYKTTKLQGSNPRACRQTEYFYSGATASDIYGEMPGVQQIADWLTGLRIVK